MECLNYAYIWIYTYAYRHIYENWEPLKLYCEKYSLIFKCSKIILSGNKKDIVNIDYNSNVWNTQSHGYTPKGRK